MLPDDARFPVPLKPLEHPAFQKLFQDCPYLSLHNKILRNQFIKLLIFTCSKFQQV